MYKSGLCRSPLTLVFFYSLIQSFNQSICHSFILHYNFFCVCLSLKSRNCPADRVEDQDCVGIRTRVPRPTIRIHNPPKEPCGPFFIAGCWLLLVVVTVVVLFCFACNETPPNKRERDTAQMNGSIRQSPSPSFLLRTGVYQQNQGVYVWRQKN